MRRISSILILAGFCGVAQANNPSEYNVFTGRLDIVGSTTTSSSGAGDNLGNHRATMTITAGYGINGTTITLVDVATVTMTPSSGGFTLNNNLSETRISGAGNIRMISTTGSSFIVRNSGDTLNLFSVDGLGGATAASINSGVVPLTVIGASGQTVSLQEWKNNGGTVLSLVDADGNAGFGGVPSSDRLFVYEGRARIRRESGTEFINLARGGVRAWSLNIDATTGGLYWITDGVGAPYEVRAAAAQTTVDLLYLKDRNSVVVTSVTTDGLLSTRYLLVDSTANLHGVVYVSSATNLWTAFKFGSQPASTASYSFAQDLNLYGVSNDGYVDNADDSIGGDGGGYVYKTGLGGAANGINSGFGGDGGDYSVFLGTAGFGLDEAGVDGEFKVRSSSDTGANLIIARLGYIAFGDINYPDTTIDGYGSLDWRGTFTVESDASANNVVHTVITPEARFPTDTIAGFGHRFPLYIQKGGNGVNAIGWAVDALWKSTGTLFTGESKAVMRIYKDTVAMPYEIVEPSSTTFLTTVFASSGAVVSTFTATSTSTFFNNRFQVLATSVVSTNDVFVPTEVYDATGWNSDLSVPTKDAIRDKFESLSVGGGASSLAVGTGTLTSFTNNVTSPTAAISFHGDQFKSLALGTTNVIYIDTMSSTGLMVISSMTNYVTHSSATANYLTLSSAAATYQYRGASGDVFLASTQTFSGVNTFNSSTSIKGPLLLNSTTGGTTGQVMLSRGLTVAPDWQPFNITRSTAGTSTSGTAGTLVSSMTAQVGMKLVNWTLHAAQTNAANNQLTATVVYTDGTTSSIATTAATAQCVLGNAGGLLRLQGGAHSSLTNGSVGKDVQTIHVVTTGAGTGTRSAAIAAQEVPI